MAKLPPIPGIPSNTPKGLYDLLRAIKTIIEAWLGKGDPSDKVVTVGMLSPRKSAQGGQQPAQLLGLGNAAYKNVGTGPNTVAAGNHTHSEYDAVGAAAQAVAEHASTGTHPWSAITEKDYAYTVPEYIAPDESLTVHEGRQLNVVYQLEVAGLLDIEGTANLL